MNKQLKQFQNHYRDEDGITNVTIREGKHKVDFLEEFKKVFSQKYMQDTYIEVDENIGFIILWEFNYLNKEFLEFCIEKDLKDEIAIEFYEHNLELNTEITDGQYISNKECFKTFNKSNDKT